MVQYNKQGMPDDMNKIGNYLGLFTVSRPHLTVKPFHFMGAQFHSLTMMDMFVDSWIHGF